MKINKLILYKLVCIFYRKDEFFKMCLFLRKCIEVIGCGNGKEGYLYFILKFFVCIFLLFICNIYFNVSRGFVSDKIKNFFCLFLYNIF